MPSRTADIKPDRDEDATKEGEATFLATFVHAQSLYMYIYMLGIYCVCTCCVHVSCAAQGEFEDTSSYTNRLEEMRKTGGDKWLSLLTADRAKQTLDSSASVSHFVRLLSECCAHNAIQHNTMQFTQDSHCQLAAQARLEPATFFILATEPHTCIYRDACEHLMLNRYVSYTAGTCSNTTRMHVNYRLQCVCVFILQDDVVTSKPHKGKRRKTHNQRPAKKEDQEIERY